MDDGRWTIDDGPIDDGRSLTHIRDKTSHGLSSRRFHALASQQGVQRVSKILSGRSRSLPAELDKPIVDTTLIDHALRVVEYDRFRRDRCLCAFHQPMLRIAFGDGRQVVVRKMLLNDGHVVAGIWIHESESNAFRGEVPIEPLNLRRVTIGYRTLGADEDQHGRDDRIQVSSLSDKVSCHGDVSRPSATRSSPDTSDPTMAQPLLWGVAASAVLSDRAARRPRARIGGSHPWVTDQLPRIPLPYC